jgi:hypothetical protein
MMHEKARARYEAMLRDCLPWPSQVDTVLDQYADGLLRATEWDAGQWGFDPDRWMEKERAELASRGGQNRPMEVI